MDMILIFGLIVLTCGSAGLWVVRFTSPLLRGIGWLGAAFAAGGISALLLLCSVSTGPLLGQALADMFTLAALVLLHVAILELADADSLVPLFGMFLLTVQAVIGLWLVAGHPSGRIRITTLSLLVAAQAGQTAFRLFRERDRGVRAPAWFTGAVLFNLMVFNLLRGLATAFHLLKPQAAHQMQAAAFILFITGALGIGFGLFWMTTTMRSSGLEHMASTDPLTRIYNRRVFLLWCEKELIRSRRSGVPFSILMIDMDHFKGINDSYGHRTGDIALCAAVERMQDSIRGIDLLGRWGGEEFAALLPHASRDAAFIVAERLRGNVEAIRLAAPRSRDGHAPATVRVTVSVGIASYDGLNDDLQSMLQRADESLYKAKAAGRNRVLAMPEPAAAELQPGHLHLMHPNEEREAKAS